MILPALVSYYELLSSRPAEEDSPSISPRNFGRAKVSYALVLSPEGELLDVQSLLQEVPRGKKTVIRPREMDVPEPVVKTVGILSNFLCESGTYMLGLDAKGKPERTQRCSDVAKQRHLEILENINNPTAQAIVRFFQSWSPGSASAHPAIVPVLDEILSGANLIFRLNLSPFAQDIPEIRAAWNRFREGSADAPEQRCLVTGQVAPIAILHPKIKGVRGAQSVGASLVSYNARAFESYGKDDMQGLNAPISEYAAFAYTTALNHLISDERHRQVIGDTTLVYWSEDGSREAQDTFAMMMGYEATPEENDVLRDLFSKLSRGQPVSPNINLKSPFYVLGLSPNAARISVRFFLRSTFGSILSNFHTLFDQLEIVRAPYDPPHLTVPALFRETINPHAREKTSIPILTGEVLYRILVGHPLPQALFGATMVRIRAERNITRGKAAIVKAYLLEKNRMYKEACTVSLNEQCTDRPYVLGRVFALLEEAQQKANPGTNTTIKDRYFSSACATPGSVFPILLKLSNHHLAKLDTGSRIHLEKRMQAALALLEAERLPPRLTLDEQGLFILGYCHQTQSHYTSKNEGGTQNG